MFKSILIAYSIHNQDSVPLELMIHRWFLLLYCLVSKEGGTLERVVIDGLIIVGGLVWFILGRFRLDGVIKFDDGIIWLVCGVVLVVVDEDILVLDVELWVLLDK